jgi:hypothetical protein
MTFREIMCDFFIFLNKTKSARREGTMREEGDFGGIWTEGRLGKPGEASEGRKTGGKRKQ